MWELIGWTVLGLFVLFFFLAAYALCAIAAISDREIERSMMHSFYRVCDKCRYEIIDGCCQCGAEGGANVCQ